MSTRLIANAIVRPPSRNFADGQTGSLLGKPNYKLALEQHEAYCRALEDCGVRLTDLAADARYPDSTFVEDTAVLTEHGAVITRPGESTRLGEIDEMKEVLRQRFEQVREICEPGTLDGGDVCRAGGKFFIGVSARTNEAGAAQLAGFLGEFGYRSTLIDVRGLSNILHLKTGLASIGDNRIVAVDELKHREELSGYEVVQVSATEAYAANCLSLNGRLLIAAGFPELRQRLQELNYKIIELEMSEFEKMDGGLSCLSLRF